MTETALLVLSGKILERPFDLDALDSIRSAIEKNLSDRGVVVARRVVTLGGERQAAAPFFLGAGFEAIPADDEDVQAATIIYAAAASSTPPDEIVFMTGIPDPVNLLRSIAGRTRRVLLRMGDSKEKDALSDELGFSLESVLSIRELLSKEGVNWSQLNLRTWDQWAQEFGALMPDGEPDDDEPEELSLIEEKTPASPVDRETFEPIEVTTTSPIAEEGPVAPVDAPASAFDVDRSAASQERVDAAASDEVDDLIRSPDLYSEFARSAPEWNRELEAFLLENGLKYSAFKATECLDRQFPGLNEFYATRPDEFREALGDKLRLIAEDENGLWLYHTDHPEMRPATATEAVSHLTLGSGFGDDEQTDFSSYTTRDDSEQFASLAQFADVMSRQCETTAKLASLDRADTYYAEELRRANDKLLEEATKLDVYLWPRGGDYRLSPEKLLKTGEFYGLFSEALSLTDKVWKSRQFFSAAFVERVMQNLANAFCLLKSAFRQYGIPAGLDRRSSAVRRWLTNISEELNGRGSSRLQWDYDVVLSTFPKAKQDHKALVEEYRSLSSRIRGREQLLEKLKYHVLQIQHRSDWTDVDDWNKVVATTTELCDRFGEPYSSLSLRAILSEVVDDIPIGADMTVAFERVVQEIRLNQVRKEESVGAFAFDIVDKSPDSPETTAARKRYAGSKVAFIGNDRNVNARERIEKAFDVELVWFTRSNLTSPDVFNACLRDPDVRLFLVHVPQGADRRIDELADAVRNAGKDFVLLEKGINPNHVARVICDQFNLLGASE
ncbi:MAG: hypothetical protein IKX88_17365 [Thermoguttaceae bacterium]|nr:hypothetical protein [Thermoguttaceae bacterium]